jgi:hypothetical protein
MAAIKPSGSVVKPPSRLQLALALAITKQKPPGADIKGKEKSELPASPGPLDD